MNSIETAQGALFDYSALDPETRIVVQQKAGEIKTIAKRVQSDVIEIGQRLAEVKQRLNGKFTAWLEAELAELGWSERTAYNFIGVYQRFGSANFAIENVAVSALYALAAPSTPVEAVEEVKALADAGEKVTNAKAQEVIERVKAKRPKQVELVEGPEEEVEIGEDLAPIESDAEAVRVCLCSHWRSSHKLSNKLKWGACIECGDCEMFQEATPEEIAERQATEKALGIGESTAPVEKREPAPVSARKRPATETSSEEFFPRPEGWFDTEIEIRIRLMPGGDAATRKIRYEVRADESNDGVPFSAVDCDEDMLLRLLPDGAYKLVEQLASEFVPGSAPTKDWKEMRREAFARWRREPVDSINLEDEEVPEPDGEQPALIELPQEEINRIAQCYAGDRLGENKSIRLAYVNGAPYLVTSGVSSGDAKNWIEAEAWPVYPPHSLTAKRINQRTYEEAKAEYYKRLEEDDDSHTPIDYNGVKININAGSRNKPADWWVMVGPKVRFIVPQAFCKTCGCVPVACRCEKEDPHAKCECGHKLENHDEHCLVCMPGVCKEFREDYSAVYENDEIEAEPEEPTLEDALEHALTSHVEGAPARWISLQRKGATDAELLARISDEFSGQGGSSVNGGWKVKGGKSPQFTWKYDGTILKGKRLLAKVREVLNIGAPDQAADDFTAERCEECKRIDGAHDRNCSKALPRKCNHPSGCDNDERPGFGYCEEHRAASVERAVAHGKKVLAKAKKSKKGHAGE